MTALWYLGVALEQTGQTEKARDTFLRLKALAGTNSVPRVDVYLEKLEMPRSNTSEHLP